MLCYVMLCYVMLCYGMAADPPDPNRKCMKRIMFYCSSILKWSLLPHVIPHLFPIVSHHLPVYLSLILCYALCEFFSFYLPVSLY